MTIFSAKTARWVGTHVLKGSLQAIGALLIYMIAIVIILMKVIPDRTENIGSNALNLRYPGMYTALK
jgi:hypothetical protein